MTVFFSWGFPATGAPVNSLTKRKMPDRLAEITNVLDWGADNTGVSSATTAIQAAIDHCIASPDVGGIVFFPPGTYSVGALTVGSSNPLVSVSLVGSGADATVLQGFSAGYIISKGAAANDSITRVADMGVTNSNRVAGAGCVKVTGTGVCISGVFGDGFYGIHTASATGVTVRDCLFSTGRINACVSALPGPEPGSMGFIVGQGVTTNCRATNYDYAFAISGTGAVVFGCSAEVNNNGFIVGWSDAGETPAYGCCVSDCETERTRTSVDLYNVTGCFVSGIVFQEGVEGTPHPSGPITTMSWNSSSHVVTVTTTGNHLITGNPYQAPQVGGTYRLAFDSIVGTWTTGTHPFVDATVTAANQFQYLGPAIDPGTFVSATWTYPVLYGYRCRKVYETVIVGTQAGGPKALASVDLDYGGVAEARNNVFMGIQGGFGWTVPTVPTKVWAGWKFISAGVLGTCPQGHMVFNDLPGQGNTIQDGPLEGQEYDIVDSPTAAAGNFAVAVTTGGGSNHVKLRYSASASAWTICG